MAYVSEITGRPVTDVDGKQVGILKDLVAKTMKEFHHPVIDAVVVRQKEKDLVIPFADVAVLLSRAIPLKRNLEDIHPYTPHEDDIFLVEDVMDKQIIDTDGARVVRVNDIELLRINGNIVVTNVDIGGLGVLRRIGLARSAQWFVTHLRRQIPQSSISWDFVEPLRRDKFMRLKVPVDKLAELHPADIAEIISDLNQAESGEILDNLDIKRLADTLEEVEPDFQASLLESMSDEKAADVLEEMSPDEAADLLAELPPKRSEDLLELMEDEEAEDVRELLRYPEDSAGGLMTTEYAAVQEDLTAGQAIVSLRESREEAETVFYVYVIDPQEHLVGVFSLSDLVFARPEIPVKELMHKRVVSVKLAEKQDKIAQIVAKYNLLAVPVVDDENHLQGMVTTDDALDKIIPTAWKKRLPRFFS